MFNWLRKTIQFTCFKNCTARKTQFLHGLPNEDIKLLLVVVPALEEVTILFNNNLNLQFQLAYSDPCAGGEYSLK